MPDPTSEDVLPLRVSLSLWHPCLWPCIFQNLLIFSFITIRECISPGVWVPKEGFVWNSMPLRWLFLVFFFFFGQIVNTKRPTWVLHRMPSFYSFFAHSSSFSSPSLGSSHSKHQIWQGCGHLSLCLSSSELTLSPAPRSVSSESPSQWHSWPPDSGRWLWHRECP